MLLAAAACAPAAWGATKTWDTTSGNGSQIDNAGGTWNTSTSNWNTGSSNTIWSDGDGASSAAISASAPPEPLLSRPSHRRLADLQ